MIIIADSFDSLYRGAIEHVLNGAESKPRGMLTRELIGVQLRLTSVKYNMLNSPARKLNYRFGVAEWLWILLGQNDTSSIVPFNANLTRFSDDGEMFAGAYGPRFREQIGYVIETLRKDLDSRQAVINIWRERPRASADVPCTLSMQFLLRDDGLTMVTTMRSNDVFLGLPYDLFTFTQIQKYVAARLDVLTNEYVHNVGSLHVYEQHYEQAENIRDEIPDVVFGAPPIEFVHRHTIHQTRAMFNMISLGNALNKELIREIIGMTEEMPHEWGSCLRFLLSKWEPCLQKDDLPFTHLMKK